MPFNESFRVRGGDLYIGIYHFLRQGGRLFFRGGGGVFWEVYFLRGGGGANVLNL